MTARQTLLKLIYPFWIFYGKLTGRRAKILENAKNLPPAQPFYDLSAELNNGQQLDFASLRGKKVLLVNTASDCGYTNQYEALQKIFEKYNDKLIVVGFPANDFKHQEKGNDEEIAEFCKMNFGVTFPLAKKSTVKRTEGQNRVFKWLTDKTKNGWTNKQPSWNFSKWLINEKGMLTHYFDPSVSPMSKEVIEAINK
jgi:glutathione peroxidase